jgi:hypothetical protein
VHVTVYVPAATNISYFALSVFPLGVTVTVGPGLLAVQVNGPLPEAVTFQTQSYTPFVGPLQVFEPKLSPICTVQVRVSVSAAPAASTTLTTTAYVPALVGVPEIFAVLPVVAIATPGGNPVVCDQLY